ncbi:MAG TPA: hypothetical protein VJY15_13905 [Candidatus Acidoferrum sp.]|nr:hypothetical protein [Candidatus Acidoferrum sp.]
MLVQPAAKFTYSGVEQGGVSQKWAANGTISAVPVQMADHRTYSR